MTLRTKRVYLGTAVTPLPSRLPWKLAREVIRLDHLSHGRLILGVGLGDAQPVTSLEQGFCHSSSHISQTNKSDAFAHDVILLLFIA